MPFLDGLTPETTPRIEGFDPHMDVPPELTWTPSLESVAKSSLGYESTVGSVARNMGERWSLYYARNSGWDAINDDYEPFDDEGVRGAVDERPELANAYAWSGSRFESELIRQNIQREDDAREVMGEASGGGVALMLAMGFVDPVNLLPVGAGYRAFETGRVVRGALEGASAGFVAGTAYEGVMQATQRTRPLEESILNVSAATLLSGVLGAGIGLVSPKERIALADGVHAAYREAHEAFNNATPSGEGLQGTGGSVGAASARTTTLADETRKPGFYAERAGELPIVGNPMGELSASPSLLSRRTARELTETAYHYAGEAKGIAAPQAVETRAKMHMGPLAFAVGAMDRLFAQHRFGTKQASAPKLRAGLQDITGRRGGDKLTYQQFYERVGMAMRRGDADAIPEVAEAAKVGRWIEDRLKKLAIDTGLWEGEPVVKTALSHLHRMYRHEKIKAKRPEFQGIVYDHLSGLREVSEDRVKQVNAWSKLAEKAKQNLERLAAKLKERASLDIPGLRAKGREAQKAASDAKRELDIRDQRVQQLKRRLATAQTRTVKPTDRIPADHPLAQDLENARTAKEPERLVNRVREMGGIKDTDGRLAAAGFKPIKMRNGKALKTKDSQIEIIAADATAAEGRGIDQVARSLASNDGFLERRVDIDGYVEDPHPDDLVAALERDAHGEAVYAEYGAHAEEIALWRDAVNFRAELERQKIDIAWSDERIAKELGLIDDYVPDTPGTRERVRQAGFYERRVADDLANEEKAFQDALKRHGEAAASAKEKLDVSQRLRAEGERMKRERSASQRQFDRYSKLVESQRELEVMSDADVRDIARQVVDKILGHDDAGAFDFDGSPNLRGALLQRTLEIQDSKIEAFLENNVEKVLRRYTRQMGADVELARAFGRPDMKDQFDAIRQDYERVRTGLTDQNKLAALDKQMSRDIDNLAHIRDVIRGTAGVPKDPDKMLVRGFRLARGGNYLRLMGGATLASLSDAGAVVLTHGMSRVFGQQGLHALVESLKGLRGIKGSADEVRRTGTASELLFDTRAHSLAEIGEDFQQGSMIERGVEFAQNKFGLVNILSGWTQFWKQFTGIISQTKIIEEAERLTKGVATPEEIEHLAYLGIDHTMATRINMQYRKAHGLEGGGAVAEQPMLGSRSPSPDVANPATAAQIKASNQVATQAALTRANEILEYKAKKGRGSYGDLASEGFTFRSTADIDAELKRAPDAAAGALEAYGKAAGWEVFFDGASDTSSYLLFRRKSNVKDADGFPVNLEVKVRVSDHANIAVNRDPPDINYAPGVQGFDDVVGQIDNARISNADDVAAGETPEISFDTPLDGGGAGSPSAVPKAAAAPKKLVEPSKGQLAALEPEPPEIRGSRTARTEKWDDAEAVDAIRAAMAKEVDVTIVTPGAGDKPKWMSTEWGKTIGQFKSFSLSAMARTTARGLQQRDAATVQGMGMMVALGMLQYYIRTRDEDIDWDNPITWVKEGVDRSGVTGWIFEALNTQEKVLGGFGINSAIGAPSARYMSRNATGAVLGPTFGLGEEALKLLGNIGKGEWSAADTHRIRKLLPAQNLFYLRWLFDRTEEGINEGLGVPDRRQQFKRRNDY